MSLKLAKLEKWPSCAARSEKGSVCKGRAIKEVEKLPLARISELSDVEKNFEWRFCKRKKNGADIKTKPDRKSETCRFFDSFANMAQVFLVSTEVECRHVGPCIGKISTSTNTYSAC